jgi:NAD(P)H dehydrogenase (quinone)
VQHLSHVAQEYRDGIFAGTNNLVEVIGGSKPMTVEDYVAATRDEFNHDGRHALRDALLSA